MAESGVPGFLASSWTGIVAPPGTPAQIVDKINIAVNAGLASPATQAQLKTLGAEAMFGTPADYTSFLAAELPKWIATAKMSGAGSD